MFGMMAGALTASPALADTATSCPVQNVQWQWVTSINLEPAIPNGQGGVFTSPGSIQVFCKQGANLVPLQGAVYTLSAMSLGLSDMYATIDTSVPFPTIGQKPATPPWILLSTGGASTLGTNLTSDANGLVNFTLDAYSPSHANLADVPQPLGMHFDVTTAIPAPGGGTVSVGWLSGTGGIFAETPELDSLFLFGSGAMGMAGYVLMRRRASRPRS
jgi:hypothetical protein